MCCNMRQCMSPSGRCWRISQCTGWYDWTYPSCSAASASSLASVRARRRLVMARISFRMFCSLRDASSPVDRQQVLGHHNWANPWQAHSAQKRSRDSHGVSSRLTHVKPPACRQCTFAARWRATHRLLGRLQLPLAAHMHTSQQGPSQPQELRSHEH